jgi:hypothetical protein
MPLSTILLGSALAWAGQLSGGYHPRAADVVIQSLELRCGSTTMRISGYGGPRPPQALATITVDGRPLRGAASERLRRDLSDRYAVYRLTGRCSGRRRGIIFYLYRELRDEDGPTLYWVGRAYIINGRVTEYT